MSFYKIFSGRLTARRIGTLNTEALDYNKYIIAFVASSEAEKFEIVTLQRRFDDSDPFTIIASNRPSIKGEYTTELGYLNPANQIDLFWVVRAVTKINGIAVYIINDNSKVIRKVFPATGAKSLARGEDWGERVDNFQLF